MLTAIGSDGHVVNCTSSVNNCTLANLHCGQTYTLNIIAKGDNCSSPAHTSTFRSVPCAPTGLSVDISCETNSAVLSWDASEGAVEYFGCAQPVNGEPLYCDGPNPHCTIEGLECGEMYNFSVEASDGVCNSSFSSPLQEGAAPCAPTDLTVRMQRIGQAHWAMMSWEKVDCPDVEYLAEITGRLQDDPQAMMVVSSYWLPRAYFEFPMPCSMAYNLTVRSKNSAGVSEPSSPFTGVTVPCAPQNVIFTGNTESARLSWDSSVFATEYKVFDVSGAVPVELCSTPELFCQVNNFDPSYTTVVAINDEGVSIASTDITGPVNRRRRRDLRTTQVYGHLHNGPEIPEKLNVKVSGVSLDMTWSKVKDATEYTLIIEEEQNEQEPPRVRSVEEDFHTETDLKPWTTYNVRLRSKNPISQSDYSSPVRITTGSS
ncbi:fibronectin type III domain-containing protein 7-like [Cheilinus undulatus]|uniref:fibronectin type III domain-containing protein 7-like n=1 Tax=Cheilinus undulatus TaxID=241271 RepID=UPI001BD67EA4|nr:fibronectin type III domain-containing protein 7-like [Cheilinus undulatus]